VLKEMQGLKGPKGLKVLKEPQVTLAQQEPKELQDL
jgi:hypothetical protein